MQSKEIRKEGSRKRVNTLTDPSKKVYLTPSEFLWDNYKRGERRMAWQDKGIEPKIKEWKDILQDEEAKITKKQLKTILKNFNNVAKGIRNINRVLKESL